MYAYYSRVADCNATLSWQQRSDPWLGAPSLFNA